MTEENDLSINIVEDGSHTGVLPVINYDNIDYGGIKISKTGKNDEPVYTIDAIYNEDTVVSATINKNTGEIECNIPNDESERKILFDKILSHAINNGAVKDGMEPLPLILCVVLSVANIKDKFRIYYQAGYDYNFDKKGSLDDYYKKMSDGFKKIYDDTDSSEINYIINVLGIPGNSGHIDILTRSNNKDLLFDTQLTTNDDNKIPYNEKIRPMYNVVIYKEDMVENGNCTFGFKDGCNESNILVKKQLQGNNSCFLMCLSYIECIKTGKIPESKIEEYFKDGMGQLLVMEQAFNFVNKKQRVFKIIDGILSSYCIDTDGVVNDESNTPNIKDTKKDLLVLENSNTNKNVTISDVIDINGANEVLELLYTNKLIEKVNELPKEAVCGEGYKEKEVEKNAGVVASDKEEQVGYKTRNSKDCFCALL